MFQRALYATCTQLYTMTRRVAKASPRSVGRMSNMHNVVEELEASILVKSFQIRIITGASWPGIRLVTPAQRTRIARLCHRRYVISTATARPTEPSARLPPQDFRARRTILATLAFDRYVRHDKLNQDEDH
ncbi:hypothetical protein PspLS_09610 [Pyricularia sp. CBS 133598]|nr:hypothetical protein PspLS_09610 [Pyricularia sp. CBS 133598]